uniref:Reverse transcriptase domain-containing protein n=1 Tax=Tanacetum cinerariifolium TaxID=118510 RepID=A0A6L2MTY4_TANCI|nr:reverse transcriptase domain-containing protein [Tanacetum cinerariifolium]
MVKEGIVLGHKISKNGLEVERAKVDVIAKLPHPTIVKGFRSFLGHAGFYRRFIQDFFKISRPMTHLLEKETPFVFFKYFIDAFKTLKKKLTEASILVVPYWNLPFELMCDASDFTIGAVLGQLSHTKYSAMEKLEDLEWIKAQNIVISTDLITATKKHLKFLEAVDDNGNLYDGCVLERAIFRYKYCWLPLLAKHSRSKVCKWRLVVPLDCEWIWHCHRLNPGNRRLDVSSTSLETCLLVSVVSLVSHSTIFLGEGLVGIEVNHNVGDYQGVIPCIRRALLEELIPLKREHDVPKTLPKPNIPYPSRLNDQKLRKKATNQMQKFFQIFQDFHFDATSVYDDIGVPNAATDDNAKATSVCDDINEADAAANDNAKVPIFDVYNTPVDNKNMLMKDVHEIINHTDPSIYGFQIMLWGSLEKNGDSLDEAKANQDVFQHRALKRMKKETLYQTACLYWKLFEGNPHYVLGRESYKRFQRTKDKNTHPQRSFRLFKSSKEATSLISLVEWLEHRRKVLAKFSGQRCY